MAPEFPDMSKLQSIDIQQTYWLLFQHMKNDFVHNSDLLQVLTTNILAPGCTSPSGPVTGTVLFPQAGTTVAAEAVAASYELLANTGAAAREETVAALEAITAQK